MSNNKTSLNDNSSYDREFIEELLTGIIKAGEKNQFSIDEVHLIFNHYDFSEAPESCGRILDLIMKVSKPKDLPSLKTENKTALNDNNLQHIAIVNGLTEGIIDLGKTNLLSLETIKFLMEEYTFEKAPKSYSKIIEATIKNSVPNKIIEDFSIPLKNKPSKSSILGL